jgi:hypothetical protein
MTFHEQVVKDIAAAAKKMNLEPEAMLAVVEVESGGKAYTQIGDKDMPLIPWEGHYFYRLLSGAKRAEAVRRGLAAQRYGIVGPKTAAVIDALSGVGVAEENL